MTVPTTDHAPSPSRTALAGAVARLRVVSRGALLLLVTAVAFEGVTRLVDWVRFQAPPWSSIAVEEQLLTRDALGEHGRPHAQYRKWVLNNVGMRGPDVSVSKPADVLRVVTAGASETFGLYESPEREYPRQLEDSLRAAISRADCSGTRVEVVNAAIFGMTLPSVDQDLRTRVAPLRPDIVVLYPTPAQYLADSVPHAALPDPTGQIDPEPWYAVLRPRAAGQFREQLKQMLPRWLMTWLRQRDIDAAIAGQRPNWRFTSVPPDRLARYDLDLRHAIGTIRALGAVAVVMTHANLFTAAGVADSAQLTAWGRFYPRATERTITAFDSSAVPVTLRAARDSGAVVVDLAAVVREQPAGAAARLFGDYAHFSDAGSALVAGALRAAVSRTGPVRARCSMGAPVVSVSRGAG